MYIEDFKWSFYVKDNNYVTSDKILPNQLYDFLSNIKEGSFSLFVLYNAEEIAQIYVNTNYISIDYKNHSSTSTVEVEYCLASFVEDIFFVIKENIIIPYLEHQKKKEEVLKFFDTLNEG